MKLIGAVYRKEMLDLLRDRRTIISMVVVPVLFIPLLMIVATKIIGRVAERSEQEARTMAIAARVQSPAVMEALREMGVRIVEKADLRAAVENKEVSAAIEEMQGPGGRPEFAVYQDSSNPTSGAGAGKIHEALGALKDRQVRDSLRRSGVAESVLNPFDVKRVNVAPEKKMAGMMWGSMLGYLLLLMMFSGGMYPVIDMTAGEKERKTLESFLATPVPRGTIVVGKTLAAITAIFTTAMLTIASMVFSLKGNAGGKGDEVSRMMGTIPLDVNSITMIVVSVLPLAVFAASVMMAIGIFARSFKEGQSYLTPLMMLVIFPAMSSMVPGLHMTPAMCLIPIFNVSQVIRATLLGEVTSLNFGITLVANLVYAGIAVYIARRRFENESVLFRT